MEPITAIATAVAAGKSLVEISKQISGLVNKKENPELLDAIYDMRSKALDLQQVIMDLRNENDELRNEIKRLQSNSDMESKLKRHESKTYLTLDNSDGTKRYICSACWELNGKDITMQWYGEGRLKCPVCKNVTYK